MPSATLERLLSPTEGNLPAEYARWVLSLAFTDEEQDRAQALSEKAQLGTLTAAERRDLEELLTANDVLIIMQAKARLSLGGAVAVRP